MDLPDPGRFWVKVDKGDPDDPKACWEWKACRDKNGYGKIGIKGKTFQAHRVSYAYHYENFDPSMVICHRCDNPPCVNPKHLFQDTAQKNNLDRDLKNRQVRGENNGTAKLNDQAIRDIRAMWKAGTSQTAIAQIYGVNQATISRIVHKKRWLHVDEKMIGAPKEVGIDGE